MYAKGRKALCNLDETLAALRRSAREEAHLTQEELRRYIIRDDIRQQNAEQRRQQHTDKPCGMSFGKVVSTSVGCSSEAALPTWYDGEFISPETDSAGRSAARRPRENDIVEDVTDRVSQAVRTLYPQLLGDVDACASDLWPSQQVGEGKEGESGDFLQEFDGNRVVQWDKNNAPLLLRCTRAASAGYAPLVLSPERKFIQVRNRSCTTPNSVGGNPPTVCLSGHVCAKLYEYDGGADPLKCALLAANRRQEERRITSGNSPGEAKEPLATRGPARRCWGARVGRKSALHTVGTAVAESCGKSIADKIRRAVKQRSVDVNGGENQSCVEPRIFVVEPQDEEVVYVHFTRPLVAHFCDGCGVCVARDVTTGLPNLCASCGEAFGAVVPLQGLDSLENDIGGHLPVVSGACERGAGLGENEGVGACGEVKGEKGVSEGQSGVKGSIAAAAMKAVKRPASISGTTVGTQVSAGSGLKPLPLTARGLYFLHLWDQVLSRR